MRFTHRPHRRLHRCCCHRLPLCLHRRLHELPLVHSVIRHLRLVHLHRFSMLPDRHIVCPPDAAGILVPRPLQKPVCVRRGAMLPPRLVDLLGVARQRERHPPEVDLRCRANTVVEFRTNLTDDGGPLGVSFSRRVARGAHGDVVRRLRPLDPRTVHVLTVVARSAPAHPCHLQSSIPGSDSSGMIRLSCLHPNAICALDVLTLHLVCLERRLICRLHLCNLLPTRRKPRCTVTFLLQYERSLSRTPEVLPLEGCCDVTPPCVGECRCLLPGPLGVYPTILSSSCAGSVGPCRLLARRGLVRWGRGRQRVACRIWYTVVIAVRCRRLCHDIILLSRVVTHGAPCRHERPAMRLQSCRLGAPPAENRGGRCPAPPDLRQIRDLVRAPALT
mmetsp:Transcript_30415/g.76116  ORF Transcript_30415/g.76116 Transcript_30415/m.76116 type:complete len:389 (+) Transcript_30415:1673-2839(+)